METAIYIGIPKGPEEETTKTNIRTLSAWEHHAILLPALYVGDTKRICEVIGFEYGNTSDPEWVEMYTQALSMVVSSNTTFRR